jgi:hypothetical protein
MTLGMSISAFTAVHVVISLLGIISGVVVVIGLLRSQCLEGWTGVFLTSTVLTSVTGFMFPFAGLLPSHVVGGISLVALAAAILALYVYRLDAAWRWIYVVGAVLALYFNVFVGVVQAFQKVSFLQPLAPTQSEAPFLVAQIAALVLCGWLGYLAFKQFRPRVPAA